MHLSIASLSLAFLGIVYAARDLSIVKQDGKQVVIKAKGTTDTLWFTVALQNGVPSFEIKGSAKGEESLAKNRMQLTWANVLEQDSDKRMSLSGTQAYWSDIQIHKSSDRISLNATMVHPEKDLAGNNFTILLDAMVDKDSDSFTLRPMIQNYPYAGTKGILSLEQSIDTTTSAKLSAGSGGQVRAGDYGDLQVLFDSGIEDGNQEIIRAPRFQSQGGSRIKQLADESKEFVVDFISTRPKNVTFVEQLKYNPKAMKIAEQVEQKEPLDTLKGMTTNGVASHQLTSVAVGSALFLGALLCLL